MSRRARLLIRLSIGIGIVALLLVGLDAREVLDRLTAADAGLAVLGIVGLVAIHLLGAVTWRVLVRCLAGVALPWRQVVPLYYASQALGGVTPANLGGDLYRIYALRADQQPGGAVWPVIIQRATSLAALSAVAAAALVLLTPVMSWAVQLVGGALAMLGFGVATVFLAAKAANRWGGHAPPEISRSALARALTYGFVLGLMFHALSIAFTYALVQAVAPGAVSFLAIAALAVARLAIALPLTPSGLGVQEGVLSFLFAGLGLPPAAGLAAILLSRVALVLTVVAGAMAFVANRGRRNTAAAEEPSPAARRSWSVLGQ